MSIQTHSLSELIAACAALTREGIGFKADTGTLKITLTGGF